MAYNETCPTILIHKIKSEIKVYLYPMESRGISKNPAKKMAHPSGTNVQLAVETCEF